ncbi:MAG: class I adenylate-forming enzyme family protein [Antricoccus sp.]
MKLHPPDRIQLYTDAGYWGHPGWIELLNAHAQAMPDKVAIIDPPNLAALCDVEPRQCTWQELTTVVEHAAAVLHAAGIKAGDVVGVQLPNSVDQVVSYLAIVRLGAILTPFAMQLGQHEIEDMAQTTKMAAFISLARMGERTPLADFTEYSAKIPSHPVIFAGSGTVPNGIESLHNRTEEAAPTRVADPNEAVTICWTSGTESKPKGVPRCTNDWRIMSIASIDAAELTHDDVLLNPFPLVNMAGIAGMLVPWLTTGATMLQHHPFDPPTFFMQIAKYRATYTVAPPALLMMVLAREDITAQMLSTLRVISSGSAPLSPTMTNGWYDRFGIEIINAFGSNEGACIAGDPKSIPDHTTRARLFPRFGSPDHQWLNRASHGMRTKLVNELGDEITDPQTPGELRITGPGVFSGYLPGTAAEPFDKDGYFCTGDIFEYVSDDLGDLKFLRYVDRLKDIVNRGGQNISAAEIEGLLLGHPAISDVAVIAIPDDVMGERACAVVVSPDQAPTVQEVADFLHAQGVAKYKIPESIRQVVELPRNPVGKILKRQLRAEATSEATS